MGLYGLLQAKCPQQLIVEKTTCNIVPHFSSTCLVWAVCALRHHEYPANCNNFCKPAGDCECIGEKCTVFTVLQGSGLQMHHVAAGTDGIRARAGSATAPSLTYSAGKLDRPGMPVLYCVNRLLPASGWVPPTGSTTPQSRSQCYMQRGPSTVFSLGSYIAKTNTVLTENHTSTCLGC